MNEPYPKTDYRIGTDEFWSRAWMYSATIAVLGGLVAISSGNTERLGYAYLFGLFTVVTFMLGGMFLVLIQFLTASHWGVSSRRIAEVIMSSAPMVAVLAVPFLTGVGLHKLSVYSDWQSVASHHQTTHDGDDHSDKRQNKALSKYDKTEAHPLLGSSSAHASVYNQSRQAHEQKEQAHTLQEAALHHKILQSKGAYLNTQGWLIRSVLYFVVWCLIALVYFRWSRLQDRTKSPRYTMRMQSCAPVALILFGSTLTFAAFDWIMSLEPGWYSTIFGVIIFAGSVVSIFALTTLIGLSWHKRGLVGNAINPQHFHDLAKLMFGFVCFWTYVQFSQWMLIWYAGIPEEATWYHSRWENGWSFVSKFADLRQFRCTIPPVDFTSPKAEPTLATNDVCLAYFHAYC